MRIEVLCTGDELLTGLTVDTNSPYFMAKLFALGEQVRRTTVVGDVREEICDALRTLSGRCDAVLVSGGLGPTADDITAACAAEVAGVPLDENAEVLQSLQARFAKRGLLITPNNKRQALVPRGAEVVLNAVGAAPLFILALGRCTLFFVPGVPREYKHLVDAGVLPRIEALLAREPNRVFRASLLLRTVGLAESHLDARVAPLARIHDQVIFGFRTQSPQNHLKLVAEGKSQKEADAALAAAEHACRDVLGQHVFGEEGDSFGGTLGKLLVERGHTVALAESCTGGRVADLLCTDAGASRFFLGSAVCYANPLKEAWLDVKPQTLARVGAVSEEVAREMAEGARARARSTWGLAVTGIAGPDGGTEEKPVGTVFCAIAGPEGTRVEKNRFHGERGMIREASAYRLLDLLRLTLLGAGA